MRNPEFAYYKFLSLFGAIPMKPQIMTKSKLSSSTFLQG